MYCAWACEDGEGGRVSSKEDVCAAETGMRGGAPLSVSGEPGPAGRDPAGPGPSDVTARGVCSVPSENGHQTAGRVRERRGVVYTHEYSLTIYSQL